MFSRITAPPGDRLLKVMQDFRADLRAEKIDLCVGVYMDETGRVPILSSVKEAERRVIAAQTSKTYVSPLGDPVFCDAMQELLIADAGGIRRDRRMRTLQTPGGSGALRVGADFLHRNASATTVWMSDPTWANHQPIFRAAGLKTATYPYWNRTTNRLDFDAMMTTLGQANPGDVVLVHACCHNPTGLDLSIAQWDALSELLAENSLLPFIDCAYQGFSTGLHEDVSGVRLMAARVPEMLVAQSCSKTFGIYRERCGALSVLAETSRLADEMLAALAVDVRTNYSMPPSHGAEIVAAVLEDAEMASLWQHEVSQMRKTLQARRTELRAMLEARQAGGDWSFLTEQTGMFSYTGFAPDLIDRLRRDFAVYMADDGRINLAGVTPLNVASLSDRIAEAIHAGGLTPS